MHYSEWNNKRRKVSIKPQERNTNIKVASKEEVARFLENEKENIRMLKCV